MELLNNKIFMNCNNFEVKRLTEREEWFHGYHGFNTDFHGYCFNDATKNFLSEELIFVAS